MKLTKQQETLILNADSKVLGTSSSRNLNIVPVSTVRIVDDVIILFNYFMKKTHENIQHNPQVSLVCWSGANGIQIKGIVDYQHSGDLFKTYTQEIAELHPGRRLHGLLVIQPQELFDISLPKNA
ncbi:MAG: hypothetical protein ACJAV6_000246 [Candidatus Paceibacteria bacterium]|jgi:hypothetical protein